MGSPFPDSTAAACKLTTPSHRRPPAGVGHAHRTPIRTPLFSPPEAQILPLGSEGGEGHGGCSPDSERSGARETGLGGPGTRGQSRSLMGPPGLSAVGDVDKRSRKGDLTRLY